MSQLIWAARLVRANRTSAGEHTCIVNLDLKPAHCYYYFFFVFHLLLCAYRCMHFVNWRISSDGSNYLRCSVLFVCVVTAAGYYVIFDQTLEHHDWFNLVNVFMFVSLNYSRKLNLICKQKGKEASKQLDYSYNSLTYVRKLALLEYYGK